MLPLSTIPQCGDWQRSSGSPWNSGAASMSSSKCSNPTVSRPSSSKRPSYPGTASTWEAVSFVTFGM
jgi:hypothetical protein